MINPKKPKLLILTQKMDLGDPTLSFFHRWVEEFAKHCENVVVICLYEGKHNLPKNVSVLSLGKEKKKSRIQYIINFFRFVFSERKNYSTVFVHMNQEYVILGGLLWRLWGIKVIMWRNHKKGNLLTHLSVLLSDRVFCTSSSSYTARFKETRIMPVGIDTEIFRRDYSFRRTPNSILFLGRISPTKNVHVFIEALRILDQSGLQFSASIYGDPDSVDGGYYSELRKASSSLEVRGKVFFHRGVPNSEAPFIYSEHEIFVNATPSGSLDKTIFEAMACECIVVTSNNSLRGTLPAGFIFSENSATELSKSISNVFALASQEKTTLGNKLRNLSLAHDISVLASRLFDTAV